MISPEAAKLRGEKSAATKLAKRITKTCKSCGKQWLEKPSHAGRRKFCSRNCMAKGLSNTKNYPCPDCGVEIIRQAHDAKKVVIIQEQSFMGKHNLPDPIE